MKGTPRHLFLLFLVALFLISASSLAVAQETLVTPSGLTASSVSGGIQLKWSKAEIGQAAKVSGYVIERSTDPTGGFEPIRNVKKSVRSYKDKGVTKGVTYYYRLRAVGAQGASSLATAAVNATVNPPPGSKFAIGDRVRVILSRNIWVYESPSLGGTRLGTQSAGFPGTITGWDFTYGKFWSVDFDYSVDGWAQESYLEKLPGPPTPVAPTITSQPANASVTVGQTAAFSVTATGTAPLSYQWQKNGANISGAASSSYTTPAATTADNGSTFRCVVSNSVGSATSNSATLTVTSVPVNPPVITSQPGNVTVTQGQTGTFSVTATGTAPLSYQWQKNSLNISGATFSSYTTPATTTADSGSTFRCIVSNSVGSVTSNSATLTVTSSPQPPPGSKFVIGDRVRVLLNTSINIFKYADYSTFAGIQNGGSPGTITGFNFTQGQFWSVDFDSGVDGWTTEYFLEKLPGSPPSIAAHPVSLTVTAGQTATFSVTAAGSTPLSYRWQKNGTNISGATSSSYTTPATATADSGSAFRCIVSNSAGSVISNSATLTVNPVVLPPSITAHPVSVTVTAGQTATFSVTATGTAPLSYQWQKNGAPIAGATATTYTTPATTTSDNGSTFRCVVSNSAGSVTSNSATLAVNAAPVAPSITTHPSSVTVTAGQTATFTVSATGTAPLSYQWQKNGTNISGATSSNYTTPATTTSDNGSTFRCVVSNSGGSVTSNQATLTVSSGAVPPSITVQPVGLTVNVGQTATFSVTATGTAPLAYQWRKNGSFVAGATGSSYATPPVTAADHGSNFMVLVSNSLGALYSANATLLVSSTPVGPTITLQPADLTVTVGQTATFSVTATGTAPLSYQWQKNGANISGATSSSHTTPATTTADNGSTFRCAVSNSAGSVTSNSATLTVNAAPVAPSITSHPASVTVTAGQTATFSVTATGTAPLSYQWQKNGAPIAGATATTYTTPATTTADNGSTFRCTVSNSAGSVPSNSATLTVNPAVNKPPVANAGPDQATQSLTTITFNGSGSSDPDGTITSYAWNFGDGTSGSGVTVSHSYAKPGTYTVTLTVTDNGGLTAIDTAVVTASNRPPVANAGPDQVAPVNQAVSFSGSGSSDPDGTIASYAWNFADGNSGSGISVSHAYANAGTYNVTLTVTDNSGATASDTAVVTITGTSVTPELVGFVPAVGTARGVAVDPATGLVYVASSEFGLAIVDVSNPTTPVALGGANPPFAGSRVAVSGSLAVLAGSSPGPSLLVVDVTDPTAPSTRGALTGTFTGVAVAGRYAYALQGVAGNPPHTDLVVVDVADPDSPAIVGRITLAGGVALRVVGSLAYVAAGTAGMQMVDLSNPAAPWIRSTIDTPGSARGLAVAGTYVYVADDSSIQVVNVASPGSPVITGALATTATSVAVAGTLLYALDGSQFKVIDVANPLAPVLRSTGDNRGAQGLDATGTLALLASPAVDPTQNKGGLYVVDATVATAPVFVTNVYGGFGSSGVAATSGLAVATAGGLRVVETSDPSSPRVVGSVAGTMSAAALAGSYAYVLEGVAGNPPHTDLIVVDLRVPSMPIVVGRVTLGGGVAVRVVGSVAYVAAATAGLQIVDVGNPAAPRIIATLDTPGSAKGVAVANGYAYVADDSSLRVVSVASPSNPVLVGTLSTGVTTVAAAGSHVYGLGSGQLKIIAVDNPAAPVLLSATSAYGAQALDVAGTLAFLVTPALGHGDPSGGVWVVDVSAPAQPVLVDQIIVPGLVRAVAAIPGFVFVGDSAAIIDVIQVAP